VSAEGDNGYCGWVSGRESSGQRAETAALDPDVLAARALHGSHNERQDVSRTNRRFAPRGLPGRGFARKPHGSKSHQQNQDRLTERSDAKNRIKPHLSGFDRRSVLLQHFDRPLKLNVSLRSELVRLFGLAGGLHGLGLFLGG